MLLNQRNDANSFVQGSLKMERLENTMEFPIPPKPKCLGLDNQNQTAGSGGGGTEE